MGQSYSHITVKFYAADVLILADLAGDSPLPVFLGAVLAKAAEDRRVIDRNIITPIRMTPPEKFMSIQVPISPIIRLAVERAVHKCQTALGCEVRLWYWCLDAIAEVARNERKRRHIYRARDAKPDECDGGNYVDVPDDPG
jgi:hypothetical protein